MLGIRNSAAVTTRGAGSIGFEPAKYQVDHVSNIVLADMPGTTKESGSGG